LENVSLSQLSLEERRKRALVHAGTEKKHNPRGWDSNCCGNASERSHDEEQPDQMDSCSFPPGTFLLKLCIS
jgi:hypothetical protein